MKKIKLFLVTTIALLIGIAQVSASNAFIAADPSTNGDAKYAYTYLGNMGYYRDYYENPSSHVIRDRINYDVVFF